MSTAQQNFPSLNTTLRQEFISGSIFGGGGAKTSKQSMQQYLPMMSHELKKLRLRISDYIKSPVLDSVCLKLWNVMLLVQYEELLLELIDVKSELPLDFEVYQVISPLF
jgi:hypothetical protein